MAEEDAATVGLRRYVITILRDHKGEGERERERWNYAY